jgi:hypothetical protein
MATGFFAFGAGIAALVSGWRDRSREWADQHMDTVDPTTRDRTEPDERPTHTEPNVPEPDYGERPEQPRPTNTPNTNGGPTMSGLPAAQIAHDMAAAMARYEPADAWAVVAESKQWPDVSAQVAMAVKAYADRLEGARFPLNPAIVGKLQEYFQSLAASRAIAEELHPLLQRAHADDIAKRDAPRGDESKWNV